MVCFHCLLTFFEERFAFRFLRGQPRAPRFFEKNRVKLLCFARPDKSDKLSEKIPLPTRSSRSKIRSTTDGSAVQKEDCMKKTEIGAADVLIRDGFWGGRIKNAVENVIPYQWRVLNDKEPGAAKSHAVANYKIAAGWNRANLRAASSRTATSPNGSRAQPTACFTSGIPNWKAISRRQSGLSARRSARMGI